MAEIKNYMEQNKKNIWVWVLIVVALVVVMFLMLNKKGVAPIEAPATETNTETASTATEPESTQDVSNPSSPVAAASISYRDALVKYADRRIQLDPVCQAHPNTVTYKDNSGIMMDNRSANTRTVKVGTTFTIKPYGFKIVVLPDIYLKSKTLLVDCDKYQNVATILVQE